MAKVKLRLGIAGLGTVGAAAVRILQEHSTMLSARSGAEFDINAVSARSRQKDRGVDLSGYDWEDDPVALARRDDIDVFIELMGGEDGPAKASIEAALETGKHVVTANKALLAHHGQAMAEAAEAANKQLRFEAAVAGGIPVIKALTEGLAANKVTRILGVMNGSCNYILTRMEDANLTYQQAFDEADGLGYLEADPELDVGGIDAAHKLALLSAIGFGAQVNYPGVATTGIGKVTIEDIRAARTLGFAIKLLGVTEPSGDGLAQLMEPCLIPEGAPLAQLKGGTNMVVIEGDAVGQLVLRGPGAGASETASAVLGDVMDIARGIDIPVFGQAAATLQKLPAKTPAREAAYYIRCPVKDEPGVLAKIAGALAASDISIDRMRQPQHEDGTATILIVTHPKSRDAMAGALAEMDNLDIMLQPPFALPIIDI
ncbi:MAG: homoserine dehydrogenase [Pseudomonadota bacterium]